MGRTPFWPCPFPYMGKKSNFDRKVVETSVGQFFFQTLEKIVLVCADSDVFFHDKNDFGGLNFLK